ncbi:hypothetical protein [Parenemella sanctibonifatiensis]|uniref:Uncharacterized protein n=1 Tax=Parenemella sanctibonifatiensis TaxID=2016505 RepID=A0A255EM46_9ACTN|nr:hypothetical protein [Parenemella sanctibonifatiensis]OYN90532.1 hypothetical protein CGZ92_01505 [Parenemella sanctibonifatiensis]
MVGLFFTVLQATPVAPPEPEDVVAGLLPLFLIVGLLVLLLVGYQFMKRGTKRVDLPRRDEVRYAQAQQAKAEQAKAEPTDPPEQPTQDPEPAADPAPTAEGEADSRTE